MSTAIILQKFLSHYINNVTKAMSRILSFNCHSNLPLLPEKTKILTIDIRLEISTNKNIFILWLQYLLKGGVFTCFDVVDICD